MMRLHNLFTISSTCMQIYSHYPKKQIIIHYDIAFNKICVNELLCRINEHFICNQTTWIP